jgi:hypothetical protein
LVFQAHQQSIESPVNQQEMKQMIMQNLSKLQASSRYWTMYRVAKQAARQVGHVDFHFGTVTMVTTWWWMW